MANGNLILAKKSGKRTLKRTLSRDFKMNKYKYLLVLPVIIYLILFAYKPMYGVIIAFKDYKPATGIMQSKWVGFKHFRNFFNDVYFWRLLRNTFTISGLSILFGFPAPIIFALLLNEIQSSWFKRTVQTLTYMPYFISLVVVCSIIKIYSQSGGVFSQLAILFGGEPQNFLMSKKYFYPIYVGSGIWQSLGWNSIIYLAALSSIDQEQYEAARIDGAGRFQQMFYITIPGLIPTIMILLILRMGGILNVGYEKILLLYSEATYEVADVISTYVYRKGIQNAAFSYSTAVGLFNSIVNVFFLFVANTFSRRLTESSLF
ncbi:MAG: sugar ABC transporter permease [Clostridiales bacterium]|nr:sugar ABC transporter permease [Clostridiales bacterium]